MAKIGLLANGSSGPWEVAIDETITGKERWFAQLEGQAIYVHFEIPSPRMVGDVIEFLRNGKRHANSQASSRNGRLLISGNKHAPAWLVRDDEFADRVFLNVGSETAPMVRITLSGADVKHIVEALRQANEDLDG